LKWDGFRCGTIIEAGRLKLVSRQGTNVSGWFPELGQMPSDVSGSEMLLDGEVIVGNGSFALRAPPPLAGVKTKVPGASEAHEWNANA
jgi:ATP-dependent DNA ligase